MDRSNVFSASFLHQSAMGMTEPLSSRSNGARSRAVVCLSGGMDSAVCAAIAAREHETYALHFSYGQRTEQKRTAVRPRRSPAISSSHSSCRSASTSSASSAAPR